MNRRYFVSTMSFLYAGITLGGGRKFPQGGICGSDYDALTFDLLKTWCDGMIAHQVNDPSNPALHGVLECPACEVIHGRCHDAVYPFMHMAHVTGEQKYLDAAINVMEWSKNVTGPDGRWTNDVEPESWAATTVFAAIALAEAIHYHGEILDPELLDQWKERLDWATKDYLSNTFETFHYGNINYGFTAMYAFNLIGRVLDNQSYMDRSRTLAKDAKGCFSDPNKLIVGEGKPFDRLSPRGLPLVDLGYNVEESLNSAVLYALEENDEELLDLLNQSMNSHLEFMLPDGAWDNSWGTRSAKWSYWGSRTSDGCQPAFSSMADRNPAFGAAAFKNAELLKQCTSDGLLHGGPHYISHGIKPCIHHTFAHAKVMAFVQDHKTTLPKIDTTTSLPRETADGIKEFPELAVWLVARGPWNATISAYDSIYRKNIQQPTGGALAVLYHDKVGPLLSASMAEYSLVEANNMQPQPGLDFPLTTRIETEKDGEWFTNLYDLTAAVKCDDDGQTIHFDVLTTLNNRKYKAIEGDPSAYRLSYRFDDKKVTITAHRSEGDIGKYGASLVLPIISPSGEAVRQVSDKRIEIRKPVGTVVVESTVPLKIKESEKGRIFNMVPGMECVPIIAQLPKARGMKASCTISVV